MAYEYKTVGGPERGTRKRGCKTASDRVAAAMQDLIQHEAMEGWEYLRTDLLPVEERQGLFGRRQTMHCSVLVFRRPVPGRLAAEREIHAPAPQVSPLRPDAAEPAGRAEPVLRLAPMVGRMPSSVPVLGQDLGQTVRMRDASAPLHSDPTGGQQPRRGGLFRKI